MKQYAGLQGGLGSRFGGGGGAKSGPFRNQAASDFAMNLKSQRGQYRQKAIMDLMGLSNEYLKLRPQERGLAQSGYEQYGTIEDLENDYYNNPRKWG